MKTTDPKVLDKIKKLLNLSDKSKNSSEEEASTALDMAHRLLRKYHLSMSQVTSLEDSNNSNSDCFELTEVEAVSYKANLLPKWLEFIIKTVNKITETKTLIKRTPVHQSVYGNLSIFFVGDNVDVSSSIELFHFLKTTVSRLSTEHSNANGGKHKYWRSFSEGCSQKLYERAVELEEELDNQLSGLNDLSIDNHELDEDDDYEESVEDLDDQIEDENFSIELYNKYKESKIDKIKEYIEQLEVEKEKVSTKTNNTEIKSFEEGQKAGDKIPLKVINKLKGKK